MLDLVASPRQRQFWLEKRDTLPQFCLAPSEIVQLYTVEDAKWGRNDPCTCGSGRKWKQCHGATPAP